MVIFIFVFFRIRKIIAYVIFFIIIFRERVRYFVGFLRIGSSFGRAGRGGGEAVVAIVAEELAVFFFVM